MKPRVLIEKKSYFNVYQRGICDIVVSWNQCHLLPWLFPPSLNYRIGPRKCISLTGNFQSSFSKQVRSIVNSIWILLEILVYWPEILIKQNVGVWAGVIQYPSRNVRGEVHFSSRPFSKFFFQASAIDCEQYLNPSWNISLLIWSIYETECGSMGLFNIHVEGWSVVLLRAIFKVFFPSKCNWLWTVFESSLNE